MAGRSVLDRANTVDILGCPCRFVFYPPQTARAITNLSDYIASGILQLTLVRLPASHQKAQVGHLQNQLNELHKQRERWIEEMRQCNLVPARDEHRWNRVNSNYEFVHKQSREVMEQHTKAIAALEEKQLDLFRGMLSVFSEALRLLPPVITSIRTELEMSSDEAAYMDVLEQSRLTMQARMAEFIEKATKQAQTPR